MIYDCLVIGTGPSSEPVIYHLSRTNLKVLIIDSGNLFENEKIKYKNKKEKYYSSLTPKQKYKGFNVLHNKKINYSNGIFSTKNFSYIYTFLSGGLSNFWGGNIYEWNSKEIMSATSIKPSEVINSYAEIKKRIKFISPGKSNEVSKTSSIILNEINKTSQLEFKDSEILINENQNINSLEENDSVQNLVWNSKFSVKKYIEKSSNLIYKKNLKAIKISKSDNFWKISCDNNFKIVELKARKIFLCAGCINSTLLSFTALNMKNLKINFNNQIAGLVPIFNIKQFLNKENKLGILPELVWKYKNKSKKVLASGCVFNNKLITYNSNEGNFIQKIFKNKFLRLKFFPKLNFMSIYCDNNKNKLYLKKTIDVNKNFFYSIKIDSKNNLLLDWFNLISKSIKISKFTPRNIYIFNLFLILLRRGGDIHYGCTMPELAEKNFPLKTSKNGELLNLKNIYVCDTSRMSNLSNLPHTFTSMAIVNTSMKNILKKKSI